MRSKNPKYPKALKTNHIIEAGVKDENLQEHHFTCDSRDHHTETFN